MAPDTRSRTAEFTAVILAAGRGRRLGAYKPLLQFGNARVIDRVIHTAQRECGTVIVIGGYEFGRLSDHLRQMHPDIRVLFNASWEQGMFTSIQTGIAQVAGPSFVHPADIPGVSAVAYSDLAAAYRHTGADIYRPRYRGKSGHPILLAETAIAAVACAKHDTTLREVQKGLTILDVEVSDQWICRDFDTREEFETMKTEFFSE